MQALPVGAQERMRDRLRLMRVALGQEPADMVIGDGTLLDTITGELLPGWGVAIAGDRIAAVGNVERHVGTGTVRVNAKGQTIVPGFVDAHYHCDSSRLSARRHAEVTLPQGLTAYFEGTHEIANAARGLPGVEYFVEAGRRVLRRGATAVWLAQMSDNPRTWKRMKITAVEQIGADAARQQTTRASG